MEDEQVKEILAAAVSKLQREDSWLLLRNLSEQSISHKLAEYLQSSVSEYGYNVDCEYNGDVDNDNGRKHIKVLYGQLEQHGFLKKYETELEEELIERAVFPDIIIHKRGSNQSNLLIIEVKKASSRVSFEYDTLKLIAYTSCQHGNHLHYQLGAFIVTNDQGNCTIDYFKNGQQI